MEEFPEYAGVLRDAVGNCWVLGYTLVNRQAFEELNLKEKLNV